MIQILMRYRFLIIFATFFMGTSFPFLYQNGDYAIHIKVDEMKFGLNPQGFEGIAPAFVKGFDAAGKEAQEAFRENGEIAKAWREYFALAGDQLKKAFENDGPMAKGLGIAFNFFLKNASKFAGLGLGFLFVAFGIPVLWRQTEKKFNQPRVVIRTNRGYYNRLYGKKEKSPFMIFHTSLEERLQELIAETIRTYKLIKGGRPGVYYRHKVLYGDPGTGKTMFLRKLAIESGMEYVEVTGSSFFQKDAGIAAIDELFRWAAAANGMIIFIDEADSLFPDREVLDQKNQEQIQIINHFLNYLGTESNKFMIVVATNRPLVFDEALDRRFPDKIEMPLPDEEMRYKILVHYRDTILLVKAQDPQLIASVQKYLTDTVLRDVASKTAGLSNGHLFYLIDELRSRSAISADGTISQKMVDEAIKIQMDFYNKRQKEKQKREEQAARQRNIEAIIA